MNTIDDYIKWRGDLTFDVAPLNNIDIVIFSQITMLFLETLITYNDSIKFEELMNKYYEIYKNDSIGLIIPGSITDILLMASKEKRYKIWDNERKKEVYRAVQREIDKIVS